MVEYNSTLNTIFQSLADPTRRDILYRLKSGGQRVGELAEQYDLTFAGVSKHLQVLERAKLVHKRRIGREQMVELSPAGLESADTYLQQYRELWEKRLDRLEDFIKNSKPRPKETRAEESA